MIKSYLTIVIVLAMQFAFTSCFVFEDSLEDRQNSSVRIRADYTLTADADAYVRKNAADRNFGKAKQMNVNSSRESEMQALIKFEIPNISDKIVKAFLKVYVCKKTKNGPKIYMTNNSWNEESVTWNIKPEPIGSIINNPGSLSNKWQLIDVTSYINKNSSLSFIFITDSSDKIVFKSKESHRKPQLLIETDADNGEGNDESRKKDKKKKDKDKKDKDKDKEDEEENNNNTNTINNGSGYFTTSSATTDLNYEDTEVFANEYRKLGYTHDKYVKKVTKNELKSLLNDNTILHFHSGHGYKGLIVGTDGDLKASDLKNYVETQYSIFATCQTLMSDDWFDAFGSNAKMIMGFTNDIFDDSALSMAKKFTSHLLNGETYLESWYLTNSSIRDHQDRWATFVKEGSEIVLYSAKGKKPRKISKGNSVVLSDHVTIDSNLLKMWNDTVKSPRNSRLVVVEEVSISLEKSLKSLIWPTRRTKMTPKEAKSKVLKELAKIGRLPDEAKLDTVIPIEKCNSSSACYTVAYQAYFVQKYKGLNLRSNSIADYISVLVNEKGIRSMDLQWSQVTPLETNLKRSKMLAVGKALTIAAEHISNIIRKPVEIVKYERVYGTSTNSDDERILVPAYEFVGHNGCRFVVNAYNGELTF